ncbi:MAG: hypothetical protein ABSG25_04130 [Bryobacteraceae bacterium]
MKYLVSATVVIVTYPNKMDREDVKHTIEARDKNEAKRKIIKFYNSKAKEYVVSYIAYINEIWEVFI